MSFHPRMGPLLGVVVTLIVTLAACASSDGADTPTTTVADTTTTTVGASPESIAIEWVESYESGDVAHYQSLMSADATFLADDGYDRAIADYFAEGGVGGANQDARDSRLLALANGSLNAVCSAENNLVSCDTMRISEFGYFTADGEPTQVDTSSYEFTIDDGVITHLTLTRFGGNLFDYGQVQGYRIWLAETHPTAHDELFFQSTILLTTEDQFEQHKTYVVEYLNSR